MRNTILILAIFLVGCVSEDHYVAVDSQSKQAQSCRDTVAGIMASRAAAKPHFADPRDAIIWQVVVSLTEKDDFGSCDDIVLALVREEGARQRALIQGYMGIGTGVLGVAGAYVIMDGIEGIAKSGQGDTITNSRIVEIGDGNAGITASSSGETLNLGSVEAINSSTAQGGIAPRQVLTGDQGRDFSGPSQSGADEGIDLNPGDDVTPEVEPLPVE